MSKSLSPFRRLLPGQHPSSGHGGSATNPKAKAATGRFITAIFTPTHTAQVVMTNYKVDNQRELLGSRRTAKVKAWPKRGLWWMTVTPMYASKLSVVRSTIKRRVQASVIRALAAQGFDEKGIAKDSENQAKPELVGSMKLLALPSLLTCSRAALDQETSQLILTLCSTQTPEAQSSSQASPLVRNMYTRSKDEHPLPIARSPVQHSRQNESKGQRRRNTRSDERQANDYWT